MSDYVLPYTGQKITELLDKVDDMPNFPLAIANGGTGATTAAASLTNLGLTATAAELNYCDGVTSNIQTQLNGKAASSHNHAASNITSGTLPIANGGTGASTAANARKALGLDMGFFSSGVKTVTRAAVGAFDLASITITEKGFYLVIGWTCSTTADSNRILSLDIALQSSPSDTLFHSVKGFCANGGGLSTCLLRNFNVDDVVKVKGCHTDTTSISYRGEIQAIKLRSI